VTRRGLVAASVCLKVAMMIVKEERGASGLLGESGVSLPVAKSLLLSGGDQRIPSGRGGDLSSGIV
jgi:hypothetical protein